jgi:hypothetical protein
MLSSLATEKMMDDLFRSKRIKKGQNIILDLQWVKLSSGCELLLILLRARFSARGLPNARS